jgi:hypothetical protein
MLMGSLSSFHVTGWLEWLKSADLDVIAADFQLLYRYVHFASYVQFLRLFESNRPGRLGLVGTSWFDVMAIDVRLAHHEPADFQVASRYAELAGHEGYSALLVA